VALLSLLSLPLAEVQVKAATQYWDPGSTPTAPGSYGGGTWNTTNTNWSNGTTDSTFVSGNTALFGGTYSGSAAAVSLGSAISANAVDFSTTGYTVTATSTNTLALASTGSGSSSAIYTSGGVTDTIAGPISFTAAGSAVTTITTGSSGDSLSLTGAITQSATATDGLTIAGSGTTTFSGTSSGIGKFNVTGGTFVDSGGTLSLTQQTYVGVNGTGTAPLFQVSGGTVAAGTLVLQVGSGGNLGAFSITSGSASFASINAGNVYNAPTGSGDGNGSISVSGGTLSTSGAIYLGSTKSGVGSLTLSGGTTNVGGVFGIDTGSSGQLNLTGATSASEIPTGYTLNVMAGGALVNTTNTYTIASALVSDVSSGTDGGLTKTGAGTLILTGSNTYNGTTTISAGTLQISAAGTSATLGTGSVVDNAALAFDRANTYLVSNAISGSGTVLVEGGGTVQFAGLANTYSGVTTINSGSTLQVSTNGSSATLGTGSVTDNGALIFDRAVNNYTISNVISGTGTLTQEGAQTDTLSSTNTYTGTTTVSAGILSLSKAGTSGSAAGGTLAASTTGITISGTGTLLLSANNAIGNTTPVNLSGGTFRTAGSSQGAAASTTGGTVSGNAFTGGSTTSGGTVTGTPTTSTVGLGKLTLNGNSTLDYYSTKATLVFSSFSVTSGTLDVINYTNNTALSSNNTNSGVDGTDDRLVFDTSLTSTQLADINFNGIAADQIELDGSFYEICPAVPEPATWAAGFLSLSALGLSQRRRLSGLLVGLRHAA
jgi:fibronectin-binding autotransporter adhesin